jgi:enoyl-CoA hydratase/carnithine racemase
MIMANIPLDAEEARIAGLVHKVFPDESFEQDVMGFCRHLAEQDGELVGAAKIAIELCADLPAHQAASVERLVNSSIMTTPHYEKLMKAHLGSIGKGKGY